MKKLVLSVCLVSFLAVLGFSRIAAADGCYMCEGGGYVKYVGDDTFEKRKKAKEQFGCNVSGTTSSCNGEKGTVSKVEAEKKENFAKK